MIILKEEINKLSAELLDIAKWKLAMVSAIAVAALGWKDIKPDSRSAILLLYSVGYLCAYFDSLHYRRGTALHNIAHYLRWYNGDDKDMIELCKYEKFVGKGRKINAYFFSDSWPNICSSIVFSIGIPLIGKFVYCVPLIDYRSLIVVSSVVFSIVLFIVYQCQRKRLLKF